jgi:hypothetical protein
MPQQNLVAKCKNRTLFENAKFQHKRLYQHGLAVELIFPRYRGQQPCSHSMGLFLGFVGTLSQTTQHPQSKPCLAQCET